LLGTFSIFFPVEGIPTPVGSRTPVTSVSDPSTQVAWYGGTPSLVTSTTGAIEKTSGGTSWNANRLFNIETFGDFSVNFEFDNNGFAMDSCAGLSFVDFGPSYNQINFCVYLANSAQLYMYENGVFISATNVGNSFQPIQLKVEGLNVNVYLNGVMTYTFPTTLPVFNNIDHGYFVFDNSLYQTGAKIKNIQLTYN